LKIKEHGYSQKPSEFVRRRNCRIENRKVRSFNIIVIQTESRVFNETLSSFLLPPFSFKILFILVLLSAPDTLILTHPLTPITIIGVAAWISLSMVEI